MPAPFVELEVGARVVRVSNPDKILFPTRDETKLDLVRYYLAVGDGIVRALLERPTQLRRFPDGVEGEAIYQKRVPEKRPDWVEVARVTFPSGRHADELCVTELAQVAWAANLAVVDFHPWPSRRRDVDRPDELRIDVDPQPGTSFADGKRVAALVREVLDEIGYTGWPKTSGNRGIHIACRIEPLWTFPEVRRCALAFAREIERRLPELVTTAWWKEERGEKIFIDYNQNARDRTIASRLLGARPAGRDRLGPGHLGRARGGGDGGLHDGDDAGPVRCARRRPGGDRRGRLRPAQSSSSGSSERSARAWARRRTRRISQRCRASRAAFSRHDVRRRDRAGPAAPLLW